MSTTDHEADFNNWLKDHRADAQRHFAIDPSRPGAALAEMIELGVPIDTWPFVLTPQFLARGTHTALQTGLTAIFDGIDTVLREKFRHDPGRIAEALRLPPWQRNLPWLAPGRDWARIARPDVVFDSAGAPWFVELNAGTPLGGLAMSAVLARMYGAWPAAAEYLRRAGASHVDTVRALAEHLIEVEHLDRSRLMVIAYWGNEDDNVPPHAYRGLVDALARYGVTAVSAAVEDLDLDGECVRLDGRRVDAVYRFFAETDSVPGFDEELWHHLLEHVRRGSVAMIGKEGADVYLDKAFIAMLSEAAGSGHLAAPLPGRINAALPWTRMMVDEFAETVVRRRGDCVLKPADGFCGRGLIFGPATEQRAWEQAVEDAVTGDQRWIVQRVVSSPMVHLASPGLSGVAFADYSTQTGVFAIGRRFAGAIRRCDPSLGLNVAVSLGAAQGSVQIL
ncbi:circularly permuted type 2 ATP-grasp protein [Nocardia tenerifensis]|uniref:circularly permuted type 2 ATP-grasp protein n=1 Tax=Nocardia tenerifensis TaxID=228006 RepID=UPI0011B499C3|nr:circularly permuted type 2 ATP-grasp protein [Nocardia tenerifensis]